MNKGNSRNLRESLYAGVTVASLALSLQTAQAQTAPGDEAEAGDIVVTARRQSESLQNVPLSVQAFGSEALENANIRDLTEVTSRIPGAKFNTSNATDPEIFMRGSGSDIQGAAADGSIGIFVDGVYLSRATGTLIDLFDLDRIEVLKGPQSLRYGKNVVGGLIHYITKKPTFETEGRIDGGYGNYNAVELGASVRGPLSDTVAAGLTVTSRTRDGFAENTLGGDEEDINVQSLRASLRFKPSDNFDMVVSGDYTRRRDGARWVDVLIPGDSTAVTYNRFFAPPIPGLPTDFTLPNRNLPFQNSDPREGPRNFNGYQNANLYGLTSNIDAELGDSLKLSSITAYRSTKVNVREDGCGVYWNFPLNPTTGVPIINSAMAAVEAQGSVVPYLTTVPDCWFDNGKRDSVKAFSQELRLASNSDGPFQWSAGVYFLREKISRTERVSFYFPDFDGITEIAFALAFGGTPATPAGGVSNAITGSRNNNFGVFAEGTYNLTEALSLNAGVRYAHDKKKFTAQRFGDSFDDPVVPGGFIATDSVSSHAWLPSVTLAYRPNDNVNVFGRIERGYKAGGYTGEGAGNPLDAIVSFKPEFATSYELGGKFQILDRKLRVNITGFFTKYDDLQTQQFLQLDPTRPPDNFVVNAVNGAEAKGVELDILVRPARSISFYANYAYTKCEFTGTLFISQGVDIDGNTCRRSPKNAFAVGMDFKQPVRDGISAVLGADLQHTSSYFFENTNSPLTANPSETTINAHAGIETDGGIKIRAWVKNLTNKRKFADKLELFGTVYANYQPPRTIGITVGYSFGGN